MVRTVIAIIVLLALLSAIPYLWPDGFSEPPVLMIGLLAAASVVALVAGRRRRRRGRGTAAGS